MSDIRVSVVIPTYNRSNLLGQCLESLEKQKSDKGCFEVIVVNDGSKDDTQKIVKSFVSRNVVNFRLITQNNRGVSSARNRGINEAVGEFIAFTDDDCILPPDWIENILNFWATCDGKVAGIGGPLDTVTAGDKSLVSRFLIYIDEFNHIPILENGLIRPIHISKLSGDEIIPYLRTSNASFRKNCLQEVGGFDPTFRKPGGEDPDLCYRILARGYHFQFISSFSVAHLSRESWASYFSSLQNYILGEIKKSRKKNLYPKPIRLSYSYLLIQKILSFILSILCFPYNLIHSLSSSQNKLSYRLAFPFIVTISKAYALSVLLRNLSLKVF